MMPDPRRSALEKAPLPVRKEGADVSRGALQVSCKCGSSGRGHCSPLSGTDPHRDPEGRLFMSINELDTTEPESYDVADVAIDDEVLDSLAPAIPAADVDDLRSRVHGPVYA